MCSSFAIRSAIVLIAASAFAQTPGEIRGTVVDARGGEALSNVAIQLIGSEHRATTDDGGRFRLPGLAAGDYTLNVSTVGYRLEKKPFHLESGETKEFEVVLAPDTLRHSDTVVVQASPFETVRQDSPATLILSGTDAKNLASVLADDPLRAVQSLPGVSSNNDFDARFSLRGAAYNRIGLFLDGILLHAPFHTVQGQNAQGSVTSFNGDMVEEMELHQGAWPQRFTNRSAGVLDVHTRDGSHTGTHFRVTASAANAGAMAEGPLGKRKRGSWLAGARKSYLQYIFERTAPDTSFIFGFQDAQGRLSYDLTARQKVTLYVLESHSALDRTRRTNLGVNSLADANYHYTLGNLGWRYTASDKLLLTARAAWMRERFENLNPTARPLGEGFYGEWVGMASATWMWNARSPLEAGLTVRRPRESGNAMRYQNNVATPRLLDSFDGTSMHTGGYAQQGWSGFSGALHVSAGGRWDRHSLSGRAAVSPHVSAVLHVTKSTRLQFGWGQYAQFPEIALLTSPLGGRGLLPIRSHQTIAGIEQRLGERTRLRLEFYDRVDRDLPYQPLFDPRLTSSGQIFVPPLNPPYANSLRGYSRGLEVFLQRSSANRFTGWISYAYGHTGMREGVSTDRFPSDQDQRHTVNIYGGYRIRPSVNLSGRWSYGSGFPIPGYLTQIGSAYFLAVSRNQARMPHYSRADVRVNKSWTRDKWKFTLYGEVVNLANRKNWLFDSFNGFNTRTGQANINLDTMFPILPSAGIVFER
jgi:hypothetical protein